MSLLINGINEVAFCIDCPCGHVDNSGVGYFNGKLMCKGQYWVPTYDKGAARHEIKECPITEIPTPHGDLIDRDDLLAYFEKESKGKSAEEALKLLYTALKAYPTVIEKEEEQ